MATSTAMFKVSKDILRWVLQTTENRLGSEWINRINKWIKEETTPTINQLKNLSKKSKIPFGDFFLSTPPKENVPLLNFRTINNSKIINASSELLRTIESIQFRADWLEDYRIKQGYSPILFVGMGNTQKNRTLSYEKIAEKILNYFDLDKAWNVKLKSNQNAFNFLRTRVSYRGIVVETSSFVGNNTHDSLNIDEFRAFVLINEYAPFIFINTKDSQNARLFSLVHELVHLWYGKTEIFNYNFQTNPQYLNKKFEQQINKIAEYILFDKSYFIKYWQNETSSDFDKIYKVARKFKTSPMATAVTAKNYKLVSQELVTEIKKATLSTVIKKSKKGPSFYDTLAYKTDHNFASAVINSTEEGNTTYLDAFNLLNVKNIKGYENLKARMEENK
ncbi:MAG: ImmA/IrrE family metallo-endopeptidase [Lactobacillus crispatus]|nr:ImmA/IrrE family metallo-endopeptidase [Lactobacillus crispatus]